MAGKKKNKLTSYLGILISILVLYGIFYAVYYFGEETTTCITDSLCLSSKDSILTLTFLQGSAILLLIVVAILTFRLCFWLLAKGYMIRVGGGLLLVLGIGGLTVFYKFVPAEDRSEFFHIIIIGIFCALAGGGMIYSGFHKK